MAQDTPTYFDTGQRERTGERTTWHGSGWVTEGGRIRLHVGPETCICMDNAGNVVVYHDNRRAW